MVLKQQNCIESTVTSLNRSIHACIIDNPVVSSYMGMRIFVDYFCDFIETSLGVETD